MTRKRKSQKDRRSLERTVLAARGRSGGASGFTLVEMMVALVAGALVVTSVYYIGTVTTRQFVEQDEISRMQQGLRLTANRLKRDIERAGFLSTPNLAKTRALCDPTGPNGTNTISNFSAIQLQDNGSIGALGGDASAEVAKNAVQLDAILLTGNFITVDEQVAEFVRPNRLIFRTDLQGFRRNFVDPSSNAISPGAFNAVYAVGRHIRLVNQTGRQMFFKIETSWAPLSNPPDKTERPWVDLESPAGDITELLSGPCSGQFFFATPIMALKYHVLAATDPRYPGSARLDRGTLNGTNAALIRVEVNLDPADPFNPNNEIDSTAQIVLDNAVYFDVDFVADQRATGATEPDFVLLDDEFAELDPNATDETGAHRLRSAVIRIGVRGPREDPRLKWPYPGARSDAPIDNQPLWRYDAVPDVEGTARVREMRLEVPLPNIANADPDIRGAT